ncbi:MAG: hypothetical protein EOP05_07220, partial [Proteobacteria bacterium]
MANEILIGMAETYDVLFTVPDNKSYEIRATVQDVTGSASAWIGSGDKVAAPAKEKPDLYASMDHDMAGMDHSIMSGMDDSKMAGMDHSKMEGLDHSKMEGMDHSKMEGMKPSKAMPPSAHAGHGAKAPKAEAKVGADLISQAIDWSSQSDAMLKQNSTTRKLGGGDPVATLTVDALKALQPTTLPKDAPVHELKLVLNGDMNRYIWHINGKVVSQDRLLYIKKGEVVRFTFVNESMMHHPMHLHGHFFRVVTD